MAMASHENFRALDDLRTLMGYNVEAVMADPEQIDRLIAKHYQAAAENISRNPQRTAKRRLAEGPKGRGESIDLEASRTPPTPTPSAS